MDHLFRFRGVAHPRGEKADYDGLFLKEDELSQRAKDLSGTPLWSEHESDKKIGWVTGAEVGEGGELVVSGVIDRSVSEEAREHARKIRRGEMTGLSLGIDHMVRVDHDGRRKVVDKKIEELSVTVDPDLPGTFISEVVEDTATWKTAQNCATVSIENFRTKNSLAKKQKELNGVLKDIFEDSQPSSSQSKMASAEGQGPTELDAVKAKLAALEEEKRTLQKQLSENTELVSTLKEDPDKIKSIVSQYQSSVRALQKQMEEDEAALIDQVAADMVAAGVDPAKNPAIFETIKNGKESPENYQPFYEFLKTTAGAASRQRASEMEKQYQEKNAQYEQSLVSNKELEERVNAAEKAKLEMEQRFQQMEEQQQRADKYQSIVSGSAPLKRMRTEEPSAEGSVAPPTPSASIFGNTDSNVIKFDTASSSMVQAIPLRRFQPIEQSNAPEEFKTRMLDIFSSAKNNTGMGVMDIGRLTGRDYGKLQDGVLSDGSIDPRAGELRASRLPQAFSHE